MKRRPPKLTHDQFHEQIRWLKQRMPDAYYIRVINADKHRETERRRKSCARAEAQDKTTA